MSVGLAAVAHLADLLSLPQAQRDAIFAAFFEALHSAV